MSAGRTVIFKQQEKTMKKTAILVLFLLLILPLLNTGCDTSDDTGPGDTGSGITAPGTTEEGVTASCTDGAVIIDGIYKYMNNTWGVNEDITYQQCLIQKDENGTKKYGWTWTFSGKAPNWVYSYPEILVGWSPWGGGTATDPSYPVKISDISSLTMTFDVDMDINGSYNLAPEIWIISSKPASPTMEKPETLITTEIMFWMDYTSGTQPSGSVVGVIESGGKQYDLWFKDSHSNSGDEVSWKVYSLVCREKQNSGTINIIGIINTLNANGYAINTEEYIASVEFGNETFGPEETSSCSGTTWINSYSVDLTVKN